MASAYVIYCKRSAVDLQPEQLADAVLATDSSLETLLPGLAGENTDFEGFYSYRLCDPQKPAVAAVRVGRAPWSTEAMSAELDDLQYNGHPSHRAIRAYMEAVVERLEVSIDAGRSTAVIISRAAALCLGSWYGGLVQAPDDTWWTVDAEVGFLALAADPVSHEPAAKSLRYAQPDLRKKPSAIRTTLAPLAAAPEEAPRYFKKSVPADCPLCKMPLYPLGRSKPEPSLTMPARLLLAGGIVGSVALWIGTGLWIRFGLEVWWARGSVLGIALFPLAFFPALWIGLRAHRMPKELKMNCSRCQWREDFVWK